MYRETDNADPDPGPYESPRLLTLKRRFERAGDQALEDHELLEALLSLQPGQPDPRQSAKMLIAQFGSIAGVFSANREQLANVPGLGPVAMLLIRLVSALALRGARQKLERAVILGASQTVIDYCTMTMANKRRERFRVLFLNTRNMLITDEIMHIGTVNHTSVYPREVMRRAIELNASALILVHNHPSGDPSPSIADVEMTMKIIETLEPLSVIVHDHIIIGKSGHASLKGLGFM